MSAVRRSQTMRTHRTSLPRPTSSPGNTTISPRRSRLHEFGTLDRISDEREDGGGETAELRKRLREAEKENARLKEQVKALSPLPRQLQDLQNEYKTLEGILDGTQRENAKSMEDIRKGKEREKKLEEGLKKMVGPSWADMLDIAPGDSPGMDVASPADDRPLPTSLGSSRGPAPRSTPRETGECAARTFLEPTPPPPRPSAPPHETQAAPTQDALPLPPHPPAAAAPDTILSQLEISRLAVLGMERRLRECERGLKEVMDRVDRAEEMEVEGLTRTKTGTNGMFETPVRRL